MIIFVIGANGVGKTSIIPHLGDVLGEKFAIHDFDERGVPNSAGSDWRRTETRHWIEIAKLSQGHGISTVISGYSKPLEIEEAASELGVSVTITLLDADAETLEKRILGRYSLEGSTEELLRTTGKTPEKFVADNVWVSTKFKEEALARGYEIVETSSLSPKQVAEKVVAHILTKSQN
jgi:broad-specificity NMP kinase